MAGKECKIIGSQSAGKSDVACTTNDPITRRNHGQTSFPSSTNDMMDFCTLGMFILDDIHYLDAPSQTSIIGGAGTYSAIGARLFSPPPQSSQVGWIIDAGPDFPQHVLDIINSWRSHAVIRPRDGSTTRGWNGYDANQVRAFKYLTPKKRLTSDDLTPELRQSKSFHLICSPLRCKELVAALPSSKIIWEPVPDVCIPSELDNTLAALKHVDVISPNHDELASLFGNSSAHEDGVNKAIVEEQVATLLSHCETCTVVIRAGKEGCFVATKQMSKWLPAYHTDPQRS